MSYLLDREKEVEMVRLEIKIPSFVFDISTTKYKVQSMFGVIGWMDFMVMGFMGSNY